MESLLFLEACDRDRRNSPSYDFSHKKVEHRSQGAVMVDGQPNLTDVTHKYNIMHNALVILSRNVVKAKERGTTATAVYLLLKQVDKDASAPFHSAQPDKNAKYA